MVRVLGDGVASAAIGPVATALDTTDVVDRSVARSSTASWIDLSDPSNPDAGRNHRVLESTLAEIPDIVLVSLGADLVPPTTDPAMQRCQPVTTQGAGSTLVAECAAAVLESVHYRQRVMAITFDLLAHTRDTRVVLIGSGGEPGTIAGTIDAQASEAAVAVADSGATWRERVAWASSPAGAADVLRQRGWI